MTHAQCICRSDDRVECVLLRYPYADKEYELLYGGCECSCHDDHEECLLCGWDENDCVCDS